MAFLTQGSMSLGADTFSEIHPKRFALDYSSPSIVMEYLVPSTGKLYHHKMRIRPDEIQTPPMQVYNRLAKKHSTYLDPRHISQEQVLDLISKLQSFSLNEEIIL